jgi:hypothetical protein
VNILFDQPVEEEDEEEMGEESVKATGPDTSRCHAAPKNS